MSYWERIKSAFGVKPEKVESDTSQIEFTPSELREMRDPTTAVGRMLNPQGVVKNSNGQHYLSGAAEMYYTGSGSPFRSIKKSDAHKEAEAAASDAYLKDAEKMKVTHPNDDGMTKNYKIINQIIKEKGLEDVSIHESTPLKGAYGMFDSDKNSIFVDDEINPFEYINSNREDTSNLMETLSSILAGKKLPKIPIAKQKQQQKEQLNRHLNTIIHELRHAEDYKKDPEHKFKYPGHFKDAPVYEWDEHASGAIQDIQAAALRRFMNMGTKKKK